MKMTYLLGFTLAFLMLGCKREAQPVQSPPTGFKTYADGTNTWQLGAVTVNGTNVLVTNVSVRAIPKKASE